jgi:hypothetical protein
LLSAKTAKVTKIWAPEFELLLSHLNPVSFIHPISTLVDVDNSVDGVPVHATLTRRSFFDQGPEFHFLYPESEAEEHVWICRIKWLG